MKKVLLILALMLGASTATFAQSTKDVLYLKNGSVIYGQLIEMVPDKQVKIKTADGSVFIYNTSEVDRIANAEKEVKEQRAERKSSFRTRKIATGFKGFIDDSYSASMNGSDFNRGGLSVSLGSQILPQLFVGAGLGLEYYNELEVLTVPVFADVRVNFINGPISPFLGVKVGYETFINGVCEDPLGRACDVQKEIEFFKEREEYTRIFNEAIENKEISLRVTHNDTKLNNILFDKYTKKALCVIDLDTIMPGVADFDFGDAIRFGANKGLEDERDLSKVGLDIELFKAFSEGFLKACGNSLNKREIELLPMAAVVMTYECGIRFLGDYIAGDKYFKISRENHNLDRARTQMKLISDMESNMDKMKKIVEKYI